MVLHLATPSLPFLLGKGAGGVRFCVQGGGATVCGPLIGSLILTSHYHHPHHHQSLAAHTMDEATVCLAGTEDPHDVASDDRESPLSICIVFLRPHNIEDTHQ